MHESDATQRMSEIEQRIDWRRDFVSGIEERLIVQERRLNKGEFGWQIRG